MSINALISQTLFKPLSHTAQSRVYHMCLLFSKYLNKIMETYLEDSSYKFRDDHVQYLMTM